MKMERQQTAQKVINYLPNRSAISKSQAVKSLPVILLFQKVTNLLRGVAIGKYPILLLVKRLESGDERVAYAMIKFTNEQAIEWELATRAGQELKHLKEDEFYGYGVNTGMGCFMDAEAALDLQAYKDKRYKEDNDFYFYEEFAEALEKNYKHTWDWLVTRFHEKVDIAMFTTGFGDGMYPSF